MGAIKHTKNEMKAQREALARYERFLPMLQLKKQQLQVEIQRIATLVAANGEAEERVRAGLASWVALLSEPVPLEDMLVVESVVTRESNIAGVTIPVFESVRMKPVETDLFATPAWLDDALAVLGDLIRLAAERDVLNEQRRLIEAELRVTNQRVNLFEKVKIPECRENIRIIRIFLGDEQTAAVARGKIAKKRM